MKEDSQLITELLYNQDFDVNTALAAYLTAQARYTDALAAYKEVETEILRKKLEPNTFTNTFTNRKPPEDMPC